MTMRAFDPTTGQLLREYEELGDDELARALSGAAAAFEDWSTRPLSERASLLQAVATVLRTDRAEWAAVMTAEMGKLTGAAVAEVDKCAAVCEHYARQGPRLLAPQVVDTDAHRSYVRFAPLGPLLAIMPWNFPFWQLFRCAAPALLAGNVVLLKHSANVPGCALAIGEVFRRAGLLPGVFTPLLVRSARVAELIAHPAVRAVTLTGSEAAGREVAAAAGRALKKSVLELGGSDPFVVLADVPDVEAVAKQAARARCINGGQSCIAAKRFIVEEPVAEAFEAALTREMAALRVGDPRSLQTEVGPLAREDLRTALHDQVLRSQAAGARLLTGGQPLQGPGWFYAPTVLVDVRPGMAAFDEETFGPLAAVTRAADAEDALALANRSRFGLGASFWSGDAVRAEELAVRAEAGCVFVNGAVRSDPRLPFGGVKDSGYGRELAEFGLREFVNVQSVWIGGGAGEDADSTSTADRRPTARR